MDEAQFEEIARQYRDNLFAIAFQYTKNAADADDMAQIALIKCYEAKKPFESEQHIRRWLIRVTVNECKRYLVSPWRCRRSTACPCTFTITRTIRCARSRKRSACARARCRPACCGRDRN